MRQYSRGCTDFYLDGQMQLVFLSDQLSATKEGRIKF